MEEKAQRLLKEQPALTSIYNNLPANSAIVLLQHYGPVSADLTREVRQFYVPVQFGPIRLSTNALYNCVSALMEFTNWELEPKKETHVKEFTAQYAYRIANDIFIEADRVYSLSVERNKQRKFLFNKYKGKRAGVRKILTPCFLEETIEEANEELENDNI